KKKFSAKITVVTYFKVLVITIGPGIAVMNRERGSKPHSRAKACAIPLQSDVNKFRRHEHQRNVQAFSAINCGKACCPHSEQEINDLKQRDDPPQEFLRISPKDTAR